MASIAGPLDAPLKLADVDVSRYDAVVVPGGHGPMEDLADDADAGRVLVEADRADKVVAAVCHGPAALLSATAADGSWVFTGRRMTALTDEEETQFGTAATAPWLLEARLREQGARFESGLAGRSAERGVPRPAQSSASASSNEPVAPGTWWRSSTRLPRSS